MMGGSLFLLALCMITDVFTFTKSSSRPKLFSMESCSVSVCQIMWFIDDAYDFCRIEMGSIVVL